MQIKVIYPPHIWNIREIRLILDAGDKVGRIMEDDTKEVDDNLTILTSRLSGIERREKILGIVPAATDTLEDRRARVHLRWYNRQFYTERLLREILDGALGSDKYTMDILLDEKMVQVRIKDASRSVMKSVTKLLEDIIPLDYLFKTILQKEMYLYQNVAVKTIAGQKVELHDNGKEVLNRGKTNMYQYVAVKSFAGLKINIYSGKEVQHNA